MARIVFFFLIVATSSFAVPIPQYGFAYNSPGFAARSFNQPTAPTDNVVEGTYTLIDPNGAKHTVHYTSDGRNGFNVSELQETTKNENDENKIDKERANNTTTNSTVTPEPEHHDKKQKHEPKIQFIPVPVYPPQVSSRGNFYGTPYFPYSGYTNTYRAPYGYPVRY